MANREQKFSKPTCGACGKLTRLAENQKSRNRVCENGHKLVDKRGARH